MIAMKYLVFGHGKVNRWRPTAKSITGTGAVVMMEALSAETETRESLR